MPLHLPKQTAILFLLVACSTSATAAEIASDVQSKPKVMGFCGGKYYPASAIGAKEEGDTFVTVAIDETGKVTGVSVFRSSGFDDLDQASIRCVTDSWHFRPATLGGKPVASTKQYKIGWKFNYQPEQNGSKPEDHVQ